MDSLPVIVSLRPYPYNNRGGKTAQAFLKSYKKARSRPRMNRCCLLYTSQQRLKQGATDRADFSLWFEKTADAKETYLAKLREMCIRDS